ncbi:GIY-YIG nuclease family protein [Neobacillus niacini]|uniref:GIY-YIG nuclease family protein n=1 Tax=Neobacillus niacini TaxID=86668 RepID=UPI002FFF5B2C
MYKFSYDDLRDMPLDIMLTKSNLYEYDHLMNEKMKSIPHNGRGIYVLYSLTGKILYVGKSENIKSRLRRHLKGNEKITRDYIPFVSSIRVLYMAEDIRRDSLFSVERWFITQLNPVFNAS